MRYSTQKPGRAGRYSNGQKRCQVCEVFIKCHALWCPCCHCRLRTGPRNTKYKVKGLMKTQESGAAVLPYGVGSDWWCV
jgi:hypothetical protein